MVRGDLVSLGKHDNAIGIVIYKHPTKEVAQIYWSDAGFTWESCGRLEIISSFDLCESFQAREPHAYVYAI